MRRAPRTSLRALRALWAASMPQQHRIHTQICSRVHPQYEYIGLHTPSKSRIVKTCAVSIHTTFPDLCATFLGSSNEQGKMSITSSKEEEQSPPMLIADERQPRYHNLDFKTDLSFLSGPHPIPPPNLKSLGSPYEWTPQYKGLMTVVSCLATLFASFAASCYSPGAAQIETEWHVSRVPVLVGITTFTSGFAIGPMFLAPFSEIYGRKLVFIATAILFTICQVCCAVTRIYPGYVHG